jgi:large subunit ribosomal protein L23
MYSSLIKRPLLTEKSTAAAERGVYTFEVAMTADKPQIKMFIEKAFKVKVVAINTSVGRNRAKRKGKIYTKVKYSKKAMITLAAGQKISIFEGA